MNMVQIGPIILGLMVVIILYRAILMNCTLDQTTLNLTKMLTIVIAAVLSLTLISVMLEGREGKLVHYLLLIVNGMEFALFPWTSYLFTIFRSERTRSRWKQNIIPIVMDSVLAFSSIWTGWIFVITPENAYLRGRFFFLNALFNLYGFFLFGGASYMNRYRYEKEERRFLLSNYLLLSLGIVIQMIWKECLLLWPCVAFTITSQYMFLNERIQKYDSLTQVYNRKVFQLKLKEIEQEKKNCYIAILDLNGLKQVNDKEGHLKGDAYIRLSAEYVGKIIGKDGHIYRIGGDEFCVICENISEEKMIEKLQRIDKSRKRLSTSLGVDEKNVGIAYGCKKCTKRDNVYEIFKKADEAMYERKKLMKR